MSTLITVTCDVEGCEETASVTIVTDQRSPDYKYHYSALYDGGLTLDSRYEGFPQGWDGSQYVTCPRHTEEKQ